MFCVEREKWYGMVVDLVLACAWTMEQGVQKVVFFKCCKIMSTAQLEGGASCFVKANVEIELGHGKRAGSEGQFCPKADTRAACGKAGVIWAAVALNRTVLATVETNDRGNQMG